MWRAEHGVPSGLTRGHGELYDRLYPTTYKILEMKQDFTGRASGGGEGTGRRGTDGSVAGLTRVGCAGGEFAHHYISGGLRVSDFPDRGCVPLEAMCHGPPEEEDG